MLTINCIPQILVICLPQLCVHNVCTFDHSLTLLQGDTAKMGQTLRLVQLNFWIYVETAWKILENLETSQTMWGNDNKHENKQLKMWKSTKIQTNICPILAVSLCMCYSNFNYIWKKMFLIIQYFNIITWVKVTDHLGNSLTTSTPNLGNQSWN